VSEIEVERVQRGRRERVRDRVAGESPLVILLNGEVLVRLRCLPAEQEALAVGFLLSEGLIEGHGAIRSVQLDPQGMEVRVDAEIASSRLDEFRRNLTLTTACGGGITSETDLPGASPGDRSGGPFVTPESIARVMAEMAERSATFRETGCVHCAALADAAGEVRVFAEDVGRHNAVDKVIGLAAREGVEPEEGILASSGRLTFEILAKLARMGVRCIVSRSAPSAQAIEIAREREITLVGFARGRRFNVYSAPWRVRLPEGGPDGAPETEGE
jgi:FdhD protein